MYNYELQYNLQPTVDACARVFREICYQNKNRLSAGIICAGVDASGSHIFSIPLGGSKIEQEFSIGGSGSAFIYGYCDKHFKSGMSMEECANFVQEAISLALSRDGSSGGCVRLAIITKEGVERRLHMGNELKMSHIQ